MKFNICGEELEYDFLDADEAERIESAIKKVQERNKPELLVGLTNSEAIRKQCHIVFDFFDEVFGEGSSKRVFKGKCNLVTALNAFGEVIKAMNNSVQEVKAIQDKYSPNRAQRRAEQHANGGSAPVKFRNGNKRKRNRG